MSRHLSSTMILGLLVWGMLLPLPAEAAPISITNFGFEDPATDTTAGPITGWTTTGTGGAGVWDINALPAGFWTVAAPQGNQIAFVSSASGPPMGVPQGSPAMISQNLGVLLLADTTYTLSGYVGTPSINGDPTFQATYTAALLAGGNLLASTSGSGPLGTFASFQFVFDSTGSSYVGQTLEIQLSSSGAQTGFDAISLDASVVPEPGTLLLLGSGLAGLGLWRRRFM